MHFLRGTTVKLGSGRGGTGGEIGGCGAQLIGASRTPVGERRDTLTSTTELRRFVGMLGQTSRRSGRTERRVIGGTNSGKTGESGGSLFTSKSSQRTTIATGNRTNDGTRETEGSAGAVSIVGIGEVVGVCATGVGGGVGCVVCGSSSDAGSGGSGGSRLRRDCDGGCWSR